MLRLHLCVAFCLILPAVPGVAAEPEFVPLFDGKTLDGWHALPGGKWEVKDGTIVGTSEKSERRHGLLASDATYGDFTVRVKFRVVQGNSGFYFRSEKVAGAVGEIFADKAKRELYRLSDGIPRMINVIADRAMLGAFTRETHEVTGELVQGAAQEVYDRPVAALPAWTGRAAAAVGIVALAAVAALLLLDGKTDRPAVVEAPPPAVSARPAHCPGYRGRRPATPACRGSFPPERGPRPGWG